MQKDNIKPCNAQNEIKGIFKGKILPVTLRLSFPIAFGNFLQFLYIMVDTKFISAIDPKSTALISGTGLVFPIYFIFLALGIGLSCGVSSLVARGIGEGNRRVIDAGADSGLIIALLIAVVALFGGYLFGDKILELLAGSKISAEGLQVGKEYFAYILPGLAIMLFGHVLYGVLQGEGLMKYMAMGMGLSTVLNIILDPIFIFTFKMGVIGAAVATSVCMGISTIFVALVFYFDKSSIKVHWNIFKAQIKLVKEIARIGGPQTLGMVALSFTFMFLNGLVSSLSEAAMNAFTLCGRMDQIIITPVVAIAATTSTMVGQNYGRKNINRVQKIYRTNIAFGLIIVVVMAIIYNLSAPYIFAEFSDCKDVVAGAVYQVQCLSFTYIGVVVAMISSNVFQSTGRAIPSLLIRILRLGVVTVPFSYILVYKLHLGMKGVFISLGTGNIFIMIVAWFWTNRYLQKIEFKQVV